MVPAAAARMSDPLLNPNFSRRWRDVPANEAAPPPAVAEPKVDTLDDRLVRLAGLLLAEHRRRRERALEGAP